MEEILAPYLKMKREQLQLLDTSAFLIYDAFRVHSTEGLQRKLGELNVRLFMVPKNMSDHPQPLAISVNKPAKKYFKRGYEQWDTEQAACQLILKKNALQLFRHAKLGLGRISGE